MCLDKGAGPDFWVDDELPDGAGGEDAGHIGEPAGAVAHVPNVPGRLQAIQLPVQAVLQQYPCTQIPLPHCEPVLHAVPFREVGGGPDGAAGDDEPPEDGGGGVELLEEVGGGVELLEDGCDDGPCEHAAGGEPAGAIVQVPWVPARLQARQLPLLLVQAVLQQYPCTHCPLPHCVPLPHAAPFGEAAKASTE